MWYKFSSSQLTRLGAVAILAVLLVGSAASRAQQSAPALAWWTAGAMLKITPDAAPPDDQVQLLHLHAARQEYAPFQIVFQTGDQPVTGIDPTFDYRIRYRASATTCRGGCPGHARSTRW